MTPAKSTKSTDSLLTVIITTSAVPSAPSTDLLESVFDSYRRHCSQLLACKVIVVFDGYEFISAKARLKKGRVTSVQAEVYNSYKDNVKRLVLDQWPHHQHLTNGDKAIISSNEGPLTFTIAQGEAEYGGPHVDGNSVFYTTAQTRDQQVTFIEPSRRLGFGLAVRTALRMTETPYVWVQQHDWRLVHDIPIDSLLQVMHTNHHPPFEQNEAAAITNEPTDQIIPVKYITFPSYGTKSYATSADVETFPALRGLTKSLKRDFHVTQPFCSSTTSFSSSLLEPSSTTTLPPQDATTETSIPLTPMFFWHDKPHIACTEHYLKRVFPSRYAMARGDFIEDKIGQKAREQMKEGLWSKWATWLYYPDDGKTLCLQHLHGRTWKGAEEEASRVAKWEQYRINLQTQVKPESLEMPLPSLVEYESMLAEVHDHEKKTTMNE